MHALIIEDEAMIAFQIQDVLRENGYTSFDLASSVEDAVEAAAHHCPNLITADVRLEPGCGIDAVEAICSGQRIPVIFVTSSSFEVMERCPGNIVVKKPFRSADITRAVARVTAKGAYHAA